MARIQCSHCPGLTSVSGLELKFSFKPLQAKCPGDDEVKRLVPQSCLTLTTPWAVAHQAPLSMGFSRQEYWSNFAFSFSRDLPDPGIKSRSPALQTDSLSSEPPGKPP